MKYVLWFTIRGRQFKLTVRRILKIFNGYELAIVRTQELVKNKIKQAFIRKRKH